MCPSNYAIALGVGIYKKNCVCLLIRLILINLPSETQRQSNTYQLIQSLFNSKTTCDWFEPTWKLCSCVFIVIVNKFGPLIGESAVYVCFSQSESKIWLRVQWPRNSIKPSSKISHLFWIYCVEFATASKKKQQFEKFWKKKSKLVFVNSEWVAQTSERVFPLTILWTSAWNENLLHSLRNTAVPTL